MRAVQMIDTGPPEVLQLAEVPEPAITQPRQIKVAVKAAGINPLDTKLRKRGVFFGNPLPAILGCDGAGEVVEVGADARRFRPGDGVWFCHGGLGAAAGNYAEYAVLDERLARPKPESLDYATAAAGPLVLITAWEALFDRAGLEPGQTALIHGGTGGVGHVAVQLAHLHGARVAATVSSREKAEMARALGADEAIVYTEGDFVEQVARWTDGRGVDVALDTAGGDTFEKTMAAMAHYGTLVTLLEPPPGVSWNAARNRNLRIGFELMLTPMIENLADALAHHGEILDQCGRWLDQGRLRLHLAQAFPLAQAAEAHAALEAGHMTGKLVLTMD